MGDVHALSDYKKCFVVQNSPLLPDGIHSRAQLFEQLGRYSEAIIERRRIIANLKDDCNITEGENVDEQLCSIKRPEMLTKEV